MQQYYREYIKSVAVIIIIGSILGGCTGAVPTSIATQQEANQFQADLTAVQSTAKVFRGGEIETNVQQDQTVNVQVDDRIEVAPESHSILNFPNFLQAELFRNANVLVADVKQESGGSNEVTLNLGQGHMFVRLNDTAIARVTVETPYSTIKTLEDGTEFDVCHNEALTCVWVKKGAAEVIGKSKKQIISAGEASYILKDQPPTSAICAPVETFIAWEENYRTNTETPALGKVVSELSPGPCAVPVTGNNQFQAGLTVVEATVKILKSTDVQKDQTVEVQAGDRIEVDPESHSILNVPDVLQVELFRNAKILLEDLKQESGGSTELTLNLNQGHLLISLSDTAIARVTVETSDSTIKTLEDGTEFAICKAPDKLTCVAVKKGVAEVVGQGKKQILNAGEASYILKDLPPSPAICIPVETFSAWEEAYRASADAPTLSKVVADLPQEPCSAAVMEVPPDATIVYKDDFTDPSTRWLQGTIDNYSFGYIAPEYYSIQILTPNNQYAVYVPDQKKYADINVDVVGIPQSGSDGDFHFGLAFRRSGDQYYAFAISTLTKKWYVLKSSSAGLETLSEGTENNIQDVEAMDAIRVTAKGSALSFYVNGRLVSQVSDPDYASGEVGLFLRTMDSSQAFINFDSIILWNNKTSVMNPYQSVKEICSNGRDDDGDNLIDKDDPECQKPNLETSATNTPFIVEPPPVTDTPTPTPSYP